MNVEDLEEDVKEATTCSQSEGAFRIAVTSAFSKSIGFVVEQKKNEEISASPLWLAPNLRSICEDLIVHRYIDKNMPNERDETLTLLLKLDFPGCPR